MADKIDQLKIGSTTYDIDLPKDATPSIASLETTDNVKIGGEVVFANSKTYTGLIGTTNNYIGCNFFFLNVMPSSWQDEWAVKYRLECDLDEGLTPTNYQYMHSTHECVIAGARGTCSAWAYFNQINHTSYRVISYHTIAETTEAGFNAGYGHQLGISFYYDGLSYAALNASYKRTIKVTIIETINCTVTFNDAPLISHNATRTDYTKLIATYYPYSSSESNNPGYLTVLNAYSQGLQETGDNDTVTRMYYTNMYIPMSSTLGLCSYSLFGFDKDGKVQAISKYDTSYTSYTTSISANRVYNTGGFYWTKGLFRYASGGYRAENTTAANNLIHADKMTDAFDFRYTDNVDASNEGTTLTINGAKAIYLRGTFGSDGLFYLAPITVTYNNTSYKRAWTQDLPTTEDGYVYWLIGYPYAFIAKGYNVKLFVDNPLYWYKDGAMREYLNYVDLYSDQTISGEKTFTDPIYFLDINDEPSLIIGQIDDADMQSVQTPHLFVDGIYAKNSSGGTVTFYDILELEDGLIYHDGATEFYLPNQDGTAALVEKQQSILTWKAYTVGYSTSIPGRQILMQGNDAWSTTLTLGCFTSTDNSTATNKTTQNVQYKPGGAIKYYSGTNAVTRQTVIDSHSLWDTYDAIELRYSFNLNSTYSKGQSIYIRMQMTNYNEQNGYTLVPVYVGGNPLVTSISNNYKGYFYVFLGTIAQDNSTLLNLSKDHPIYYCDGTYSARLFSGIDENYVSHTYFVTDMDQISSTLIKRLHQGDVLNQQDDDAAYVMFSEYDDPARCFRAVTGTKIKEYWYVPDQSEEGWEFDEYQEYPVGGQTVKIVDLTNL